MRGNHSASRGCRHPSDGVLRRALSRARRALVRGRQVRVQGQAVRRRGGTADVGVEDKDFIRIGAQDVSRQIDASVLGGETERLCGPPTASRLGISRAPQPRGSVIRRPVAAALVLVVGQRQRSVSILVKSPGALSSARTGEARAETISTRSRSHRSCRRHRKPTSSTSRATLGLHAPSGKANCSTSSPVCGAKSRRYGDLRRGRLRPSSSAGGPDG